MELDDIIEQASAEYLGNVLVLRFSESAQIAVFDYLRRRDNPEFLIRNSQPNQRQLAVAQENTLRFLRYAEKFARDERQSVVDERFIKMAWIKLCPGLYPFC